jgi:hypothetical protein
METASLNAVDWLRPIARKTQFIVPEEGEQLSWQRDRTGQAGRQVRSHHQEGRCAAAAAEGSRPEGGSRGSRGLPVCAAGTKNDGATGHHGNS